MKAVVQRVKKASVKVSGKIVGKIGPGLVILLGVGEKDTERDAEYLAEKIANLRIFADKNGKMNLSALETKGEILAVSQFTLYGDTKKGRRPSFVQAAEPKKAEKLFGYFVEKLKETGLKVETGKFRAKMLVEILNDGPVTLILETPSCIISHEF